jgi:hypothetical protein
MIHFSRFVASTMLAFAPCNDAEIVPTQDELQRQVAELRQRIARLESSQRAVGDAQVAAAVDAVFTDAQRRSQLLSVEGFTAGWDKGFVIRSADGAYRLQAGFLFQFRNITDFRDNADADGDDDIQNGFEIRRTQLIFQGNIFSPNLGYLFMFEAGKDGDTALQDAFISYKFAQTPWTLKAGQYFDPVSPELRNGPPRRLAVEPSVADFLIGGGREDRVQGASLIYGGYAADTPVNVEVMLHDGLASKNTGFADTTTSFGVAGRAEFKCFGDWPNYKDFTAAGNKNDLLVFGVGADYTDGDNAASVLAQVDALWEPGKFAFYGALLMRNLDRRNSALDDTFDFGGVAQAAWLFNEHCEGFVRYSLTEFGEPPVDADDSIHEFCIGGNYYISPSAPHHAKITVDLTYLPNGAPASLSGFGIAGGTSDDEIVLRAQFQLFL